MRVMKQSKRKSETATVAVLKAKRPEAKSAPVDVPLEGKPESRSEAQASATQTAAASVKKAKVDSVTYTLAANCTVRDSVALQNDLLKLLDDARRVIFDVGAVDRIDTAAMQVLYAFARDRKARGGEVSWQGCTEEFSTAARLLGMKSALGISSAAVSGAAA